MSTICRYYTIMNQMSCDLKKQLKIRIRKYKSKLQIIINDDASSRNKNK